MKTSTLAVLAIVLTLPAAAAPASDPVRIVLAVGDIASCGSDGDEGTAALVGARPAALVLALGDTVYQSGTDEEYARCYQPSWGRFRARTRPVLGNHEYLSSGAAGFFRYFGARAGPRRGYSSFDVGMWHVVVLNSNCGPAGGCGAGSPQERWLRTDLAAHDARCTLAAMHHPRFSSGRHGDHESIDALWRALVRGGVDVVLAGHDHHYERLRVDGIREFVVGTGGRSLYPVFGRTEGSEVRQWGTYGVLRLGLRADRYDWEFLPVGDGFRERGSERCR